MTKFKKLLSLSIAATLILSIFCNIPAFVSAESAKGCYIDFSRYSFDPLTKEVYDEFKENNPNGTPTAGNMYDVNIYNGNKVGTYSLVDDSTASGGKYLNYVKDSGGENYQLTGYMFVANPTGNYATDGGTYHTVLKVGTAYSMKIRYKITDLTDGYNLNLFAFPSNGVATPNNVANWQDRVNIELTIGNTGGWVEETYSFKMPDSYTGKDPHSLMLGFEPRVNGKTSRPADGTAVTYNLSVDYIEITEAAAPQHMEIDFGSYKVTKVSESSGSIANNADALWQIASDDSGNKFMQYPSNGNMTSDSSLPYGFMANPTGSASFADRANAFILDEGAEYRISFKYRLSELATGGKLTFKVGATGGSNCMNGWSAANTGIALTSLDGGTADLQASDDWKTVSYTFTMTTTATGTDIRRSMQVAFVPNWAQRTVAYTLDVDDIVVDRLTAVTVVDENGNRTVQKGAPAAPASDKAGFGGNTADKLVLDTAENIEVYGRPKAECIERTEYYYDSTFTRPLVSTDFPAADEIIYSKKYFKQSSVNQVAFNGFDGQHMYRSDVDWKDNTFSGNMCYSNTTTENVWKIVDTESFTGSKSMHMALSGGYSRARKFLYIGNGYEYEDNVTYKVTLRIKKDSSAEQHGNLKMTLGGGGDVYGRFISGGEGSVITVAADELSEEWTEYTIPITFVPQTLANQPNYGADYYRGPAIEFNTDSNVAIFIDSITISTVIGSVSGGLTEDGKDLRITSSYIDNGEDKVVLAGTEYAVVERGILAKSSTNTVALTGGNSGVLSVKKTDGFGDYWADGENGEKIFSMLIKEIDDRSVTARAYVKLSDGITYYSPESVITGGNAPEGYSLVWGDEFDGTRLNASKWVTAGADTYDSKNSVVYYSNNDKNVAVENGMLKLKLEHRGESEYEYKYNAPAGLATNGTMNFKYGFIEMRAKIPYKNGIQSSFWFKSDASVSEAEKKSDTAAEIDMVETFGLTDTVTPNIHKWYTADDNKEHSQYNNDGRTAKTHKFENDEADEFHIYGMEWTETEIIMYIDGAEYARYDITRPYESAGKEVGSMEAFNDPMRIIIGCSPYLSELGHYDFIGDGSGYTTEVTDFSQAYCIDWVRLYQKDGCELFTK